MNSPLQKAIFRTGAPAATLIFCAFFASHIRPQGIPQSAEIVELTHTDLFSLPDWQRKTVSVNGFVLGMTREQAFEIAQADNLRLLTNLAPKTVGELNGPCRRDESSCKVCRVKGPWIGVDLFFAADRLAKIKVSIPPDDAVEDVKKVNVARQFKASTFHFFNHYSDSLRNLVLGPAEGKEKPALRGAALTYVEYDYPQSGLIVHTTIDKRDHPPKPFDLEIDFVSRQGKP